MVIEEYQKVEPFFAWLFASMPVFLIAMVAFVVIGFLIGYLMCAFRHGPSEGFNVLFKSLITSVPDLVLTSPRRTMAIARLAVKESLRRYVLVVFAIFVLLILLGGWFLDGDSEHPARLYISFVLTSTNFLILMLAMVLSTFSLPNDIKSRTIYTVVTKPVRSGEIVLGRILGFSIVGTALLILMCLVSYVFVVGGLRHSHNVVADDIEFVDEGNAGQGRTTYNSHHRHEIIIDEDGNAYAEHAKGHTHSVTLDGEGENAKITVGSPEGMLQARVWQLGQLRFVDQQGADIEGKNVGEEWMYRKYIAGPMRGGATEFAIWRFNNVTPDRFASALTAEEKAAWDKDASTRNEEEQALAERADYKQGLPLELTLAVFRTNKGDIEQRVRGEIRIQNPDTGKQVRSEPIEFISQEFSVQSLTIPRTLQVRDEATGELKSVDLYNDLVNEGEVEILVNCADSHQYFGAATPDLYLRAADRSFGWNFFKGYLSIWLQMIIVVCFGVTLSTMVSGPLALLGSIGVFIFGFCQHFVENLGRSILFGEKTAFGGGPIEALIRILTQRSISTELDIPGTSIIKMFDQGITGLMWAVVQVLPNFSNFDTSRYVAYGYNIDGNLLAQQGLITLMYTIGLTIVGYFILKSREIAA